MENLSARKETQGTPQNELWKKVCGSCAVSRGLKRAAEGLTSMKSHT